MLQGDATRDGIRNQLCADFDGRRFVAVDSARKHDVSVGMHTRNKTNDTRVPHFHFGAAIGSDRCEFHGRQVQRVFTRQREEISAGLEQLSLQHLLLQQGRRRFVNLLLICHLLFLRTESEKKKCALLQLKRVCLAPFSPRCALHSALARPEHKKKTCRRAGTSQVWAHEKVEADFKEKQTAIVVVAHIQFALTHIIHPANSHKCCNQQMHLY
jgi:hypothetical protein